MSDIDNETYQWLSSLKLGDKLQYISDFQNGYYLGVIFERLNLAKGRKFKNTKDMACKFQNFKNVRDLLYQNFKVDFPIQNILYNAETLLTTIRDCCHKYNKDRKEATMKKIQSFSESKIQPHQEKMFASRQKDILSTSKLNQTGSKFPKKIIQIESKLQKYRDIKTQHQLMALQDRKRQLQQNRRAIEQHRYFQINKVRATHQFVKEHQRKVYDVWMKTQQIKKIRIQKDTNLNKFLEEKKNKFYQSLRDEEVNTFNEGLEAFQLNCIRQGIELQHDPNKPKHPAQQNFNKQVVLERIKDNIKIHQKQKNRQKAEKKNGGQKLKNRSFTELPQAVISEQERNNQYRRKKIQYLDETVVRLQRRQKKHKAIAQNALQAIIDLIISNEETYENNKGFNYAQWKQIEKQFLAFQKKERRAKDQSRYIDASYQTSTTQYINQSGVWAFKQKTEQKLSLSEVISHLIEIAYPKIQLPQKINVPLYMPVKIGFVGDSLSGKSTISQKLSAKYGVIVINPHTVIHQAFQLNKQPVVQDPKKKKDSKKPEEQNPEKIALKEWGADLMKRLHNVNEATIEHYFEAIQFKLNYNFQNKVGQQIIKQFQESKTAQTQRFNKALKQFEQLQKKGKKDSKKGGAPQSDEPPSQRKYFYTKGFIIDGIDLSLQNIKFLQKRLNGFISFQQRINPKGEQTKSLISNIIPIPKAIKDNKLHQGVFDLLIQLEAKNQILESRQTGQKSIISHKDNSSIESYYSCFGDEHTKCKAFHKINNETSIQECCSEITKVIESLLDSKYEAIHNANQQKSEVHIVEQANTQTPIISALKNITKSSSQMLLNRFINFYQSYFSKITQSFSDLDSHRDSFQKQILSAQQHFISIISRPDDKAGKILNFQENYNKLLSEKTNIVKDVEASKHLISKLDELYDSLWTSLQSKKNEAVQQRQKIMNSNMLNSQIQKIIEVSKVLIQNQLTLLVQIVFFIYNLNNALNGSKEDIPCEYLVLGISAHLEPISSFQNIHFTSERFNYYCKQTYEYLNNLTEWLNKKQKKFKIIKNQIIEPILKQFIQNRVANVKQRITQINSKIKQMYLEYYCFFKVLVNKMDDWIILGIKYQNQFVYDIYKNMKKNITQARKSGIKDLFVKDITELLHPISSLPHQRLPISECTQQLKLKILSYATFMQQIKCLAQGGRIPFKQFQYYFQKRIKSKLLDQQLLKINYDQVQQYLVTDQYLNYKELALAMLLWKIPIFNQDQISQYEGQLCGRNNQTIQQNYQFIKEQLHFKEFQLIFNLTSNPEQYKILKGFIFQIFRQQSKDTIVIKDLIDTLKLFNQLQVDKFGETLMMLHQTSHKHVEVN